MRWTDEGIVLGSRHHGEANAILELMTQEHGRHLGLVRGGAGSRLRPVLQPGNRLKATWRARLDEHLGLYAVEGLDLDRCAATGATAELAYVSPKTGRAVSREAGRPWQDKLLRLPGFLSEAGSAAQPSAADLADGFAVTGFFLARHVLDPRGLALPDARNSFIGSVLNVNDRARSRAT